METALVDDQLVAVLPVLALRPQHPDPIGSGRIDGVALLQQEGPRLQLRHRPKLHQDVGVERWVIEGLLLVAETSAQLAQQASEGGRHRRDGEWPDPMGLAPMPR